MRARTLGMAVAAALVAACSRAPQPAAPAARPRWQPPFPWHPPPPIVEDVGPRVAPAPVAPRILLPRPASLAPSGALPTRASTWTPALPPRPVVLTPGRPASGGDALRLADLALARGDAQDAIAQYRARRKVATAPDEIAYLELALARTYLVRLEPHEAEGHLWAAAADPGVVGWAALVLLADERAGRDGAGAALADLREIAGERGELLAAYLVHTGDPALTASILMDMATRAPLSRACPYALEAVARGQRVVPDELPRACWPDVTRAIAAATGVAWVDPAIEVRRRLLAAAATWDQLAVAAASGKARPAPWAALAGEYLGIVALAIEPRDAELASYGAVAAAHNADVIDPYGSRTIEWLRRAYFDLPASARAAASDAFERYWLDPRAPPP